MHPPVLGATLADSAWSLRLVLRRYLHRTLGSNLTLGYNHRVTDVSKAASLMGRKSAQARQKKWGKQEFVRKMREWGRLGGRPKGRGKKKGGVK
jgi:hypothetical protein